MLSLEDGVEFSPLALNKRVHFFASGAERGERGTVIAPKIEAERGDSFWRERQARGRGDVVDQAAKHGGLDGGFVHVPGQGAGGGEVLLVERH